MLACYGLSCSPSMRVEVLNCRDWSDTFIFDLLNWLDGKRRRYPRKRHRKPGKRRRWKNRIVVIKYEVPHGIHDQTCRSWNSRSNISIMIIYRKWFIRSIMSVWSDSSWSNSPWSYNPWSNNSWSRLHDRYFMIE